MSRSREPAPDGPGPGAHPAPPPDVAPAATSTDTLAGERPGAHRRVMDDLLAWGRPRPPADPDLPRELEERITAGLRGLDVDEPLWVGKSMLRALACDGRWLDLQSTPFTPSAAMLTGTLTHRAIELDTNARRGVDLDVVLDRAEHEVAVDPTSREAELLNGFVPLQRADVRATCRDRLVEWRALWPLLDEVEVTFEHRLRARFADGDVVASGRPDLVVRSRRPRGDVATDLVMDLKTGWRNEVADRADLRLYALLWTLKYRRPPFRWATFYLAEGRWDHEDLDPALLRGAADRLVDGVRRAAALRDGVPEDQLVLVPGSHCSFCGRRDTCPVAPPRR